MNTCVGEFDQRAVQEGRQQWWIAASIAFAVLLAVDGWCLMRWHRAVTLERDASWMDARIPTVIEAAHAEIAYRDATEPVRGGLHIPEYGPWLKTERVKELDDRILRLKEQALFARYQVIAVGVPALLFTLVFTPAAWYWCRR